MLLCYLIVGIVCAIIGASIGAARGWPGIGCLLGLLFGPVGLLITCLLPVEPPSTVVARAHRPEYYRASSSTRAYEQLLIAAIVIVAIACLIVSGLIIAQVW